jgi:hypothetical protein
MQRISMSLGSLALVFGCYFSVTWFFFGSAHPCGILETRQKPYVLEAANRVSSKRKQTAFVLLRAGQIEAGITMLEGANAIPKEYLDGLHNSIWDMTPAQCAIRAIAWDVYPYKSSLLSDEDKRFLETIPDKQKKESARPNSTKAPV